MRPTPFFSALLFALSLCLLPTTAQAQPTAHFDLALESSGLVVRASGQDALDLIHHASTREASYRRACNERGEQILSGLFAGDARLLAAAFDRKSSARGVADITQMIDVQKAAYGPVVGFEVLGSAPRADGATYTFVRTDFTTRTVVFRMIWHKEHLLSILSGTPASMKDRIAPALETPPTREVVAR